MIVTRKFNMVLEEMQARWAQGKSEETGGAKVFQSEETFALQDDHQTGESMRESLDRLGSKMQQLCVVVMDLSAQSDALVNVRAAHRPVVYSGRSGWCWDSGN